MRKMPCCAGGHIARVAILHHPQQEGGAEACMLVRTCMHAHVRALPMQDGHVRRKQNRGGGGATTILARAILREWPDCAGSHIALVGGWGGGGYCMDCGIALMAILHDRTYCTSCRITQVAVLHIWQYCMCDHVAWVVVLHGWPYCTRGRVALVVMLNGWPYCTGAVFGGHIARGNHIAPLAILHAQPYCMCGHIALVAILHVCLCKTHNRGQKKIREGTPSFPSELDFVLNWTKAGL